MRYTQRSVATAICAMAVATGLFVNTSVELPVHLAAGTALVMGGNSNPQGVTMDTELNGYISTKPGTPYDGYDYSVVVWSAQIPFTGGSTGVTYDDSQAEGLEKISSAVDAQYSPGNPMLVVGYSSSAAVVTKLLRRLQAERDAGATTPSTDDLTFILIGNPNRPNGGVLARFPGVHIGAPVGATFDGATPGTEYIVTDISWQYDGISDFPLYTSNLLAVANAMLGFLTLHGQYYSADPTNKDQILSDVTVDNTRYVTLRGDLPLLAPLYLLGVPRPLLAGLDAALRIEIERGYDRSIRPDTSTPARFLPPLPTLPTVTTTRLATADTHRAGSSTPQTIVATDHSGGSTDTGGSTTGPADAPTPTTGSSTPISTPATPPTSTTSTTSVTPNAGDATAGGSATSGTQAGDPPTSQTQGNAVPTRQTATTQAAA